MRNEPCSGQEVDHGNMELRLTNRTSRHANVAVIDRRFPDELWRCESVE